MGKTKINNKMIECSYVTAIKVFNKEIGRKDGEKEISRNTGMGEGSASIYITAVLSMINRNLYTHTINFNATKFFWDHIGTDYGREAQKKAALITREHVQYYKIKHCYLAKIDKLAQQYLEDDRIN